MNRFVKSLLAGIGLTALIGGSHAEEQVTLPSFDEARVDTENWREVDPENLIIFKVQTYDLADRGTIYIETADFAAPGHTAQFKKVVQSGDYDGTVFHRVIDDFMAQGGDVLAKDPSKQWPNLNQEFVFKRAPNDDADNVPGSALLGDPLRSKAGYIDGFPIGTQVEGVASLVADGKVESWIRHCPGVVSAARTDDPNSAGTQFFLMRYTAEHLDKSYTAWGRVLVGLDVVRNIKKGKGGNGELKAYEADKLVKAVLASDLPDEERPTILVQRTDGPMFAEFLALHANERDVCNLPPVPAILSKP